MITRIGWITLLAVALTGCTNKTEFVTIGTGSMTGVYYPTGGAIAKMINRKKKEYGIRASVESTAGSVYNINAVLSGDLELGVAQSDRQYQATKGLAEWKGKGPQAKLRSVCSFHPEVITLVATDESKIQSLKDLKGKRVNIGNPGSGQRGNAMDVLSTAGLDADRDIKAESLSAGEAPKMVQDNRLDAFFYTVGHPSGAITEATSGRKKMHFVPITGMDELLKRFPFYAKAVIPAEAYPMSSSKKDVPSIGVKATLVTSADVSEKTIYAITKEIFENLKEFRQLHPAFARLEASNMLEGLSAPMHPGAAKYFKEKGLTTP